MAKTRAHEARLATAPVLQSLSRIGIGLKQPVMGRIMTCHLQSAQQKRSEIAGAHVDCHCRGGDLGAEAGRGRFGTDACPEEEAAHAALLVGVSGRRVGAHFIAFEAETDGGPPNDVVLDPLLRTKEPEKRSVRLRKAFGTAR